MIYANINNKKGGGSPPFFGGAKPRQKEKKLAFGLPYWRKPMGQTAFVNKWDFRFALLAHANVANRLWNAFGLGYARLPRRDGKPKTYPCEAKDLPM